MKRALPLILLGSLLLLAGCSMHGIPGMPWVPWNGMGFLSFLMWPVSLALYFLPTIIAAVRHCSHLVAIILINVFLGWTGIGWIGALV